MEQYHVKVDSFEGPLDLLLHLIQRDQLNICDIPIASITEQYLEYIKIMRALDLNVAGEFLVMAATLTYIKSRMLLPSAAEDEEDEEDPRSELVHRLLEYKKYKEAALNLSHRDLLDRDVFIRPSQEEEDREGEIEADLFQLIDALCDLLQRRKLEEFHEVTVDRVSLVDKIRELWGRMQDSKEATTFLSLFDCDRARDEVVITFLAILELIRSGMVRAYQREVFGPLWIVKA